MTDANLMAVFRKTGIVPFDSSPGLTQLNINPSSSSTATPTIRKERKDTKAVKVLLTERIKKVEKKALSTKKAPVRRSIIPAEGKAVTEESFLEKLVGKSVKKSVGKENLCEENGMFRKIYLTLNLSSFLHCTELYHNLPTIASKGLQYY